jgi:hypothetical protein
LSSSLSTTGTFQAGHSNLTVADLYSDLGTSREELVNLEPSRFIVNARNEETPTQQLGFACFQSERISAMDRGVPPK